MLGGTMIMLFSMFFNFNLAFAQDASFHDHQIDLLKKNKLFSDYFHKFKILVKNDDKIGLAKFLDSSYRYELWGTLDKQGGKLYEKTSFKIRNRKDFIRYYPRLFDRRMRNTISKKELKDFIINQNGFGLYRGQVWFQYSKEKKIVFISSINNNSYIFP